MWATPLIKSWADSAQVRDASLVEVLTLGGKASKIGDRGGGRNIGAPPKPTTKERGGGREGQERPG